METTERFINVIISFGAGGIISALVTKLIVHKLEKKFTKYEASIKARLPTARKKQTLAIKLWKLIAAVDKHCSNFPNKNAMQRLDKKRVNECYDILDVSLNNLDEFIRENAPFLNEDIKSLCERLSIEASPDTYQAEDYKEKILNIIDELSKKIKLFTEL